VKISPYNEPRADGFLQAILSTTTSSPDPELEIRESIPLAPHTTIGIGGNARFFADVATTETLLAAIDWARNHSIPMIVIGGGSNLIIADRGFDGIIVRVSINGIRSQPQSDRTTITVGAGEDWEEFVAFCVASGYSGLECLSGIPGRTGATPIQNVGAYGQEVAEVISSIEAVEVETGRLVNIPSDQCGFAYRSSRFKTYDRNRFIITAVTFTLPLNGRPDVRYDALARYLAEHTVAPPSLRDVREAVLAVRRTRSMVVDPCDPYSQSVGSFFVNPIVPEDQFRQIQAAARRRTIAEEVPVYLSPDGLCKVPAAWLIEHAGYRRGHHHGNVGLSPNHALAIVNRGGGTAREVLELAARIKSSVLASFGVTLAAEPVFIGFDDGEVTL
jgi:UDP-N-acetylmuramate dehydrogenase